MKSVLHIGFDILSHSRRGLENGFKEAGFTEYNFFAWQNLRMSYGILATQERMIAVAKTLKPDLIFMQLQNSDICDDETVIELSKCGYTVNYTYDIRKADEMEWYYKLAPLFGLTLFACKEDAEAARRRWINNVSHIHSSCDPEQYRPVEVKCDCACHKNDGDNMVMHIMPCCDGSILRGEGRRGQLQRKNHYPDIVFVGNNYQNTNLSFDLKRQRFLMAEFMKNQFGNKFGTFGMNWGPESKYYNPIDENNIYNSAKIAVCHNNFLRAGYASDRQWRAMACGIATIPQYYPGIEGDRLGGLEYVWENMADLDRICRRLLENEDERKELAEFQHNSFLAMHQWKHRIQSIKEMIHEPAKQ